MKKLVFLIFALLLVFGCTSSKKHFRRGHYDAAISKSVKVLLKKPEKEKEIQILEQAYHQANQVDNDRVLFLKKTGQPDIWEEVFGTLNKMKIRQNKVKRLNQNILTQIRFVSVDYDNELIEAQKKAAEFFYARAVSLLSTKEKISARKAYDDLQKVKSYYSNYRDVDQRIQEAINYGTNYVLFRIQNNARVILPKDFESEMLKVSLRELNSRWLSYETQENKNYYYDYTIILNLKMIDVSPELVKQRDFSESAEVEDGWQYVKDKNGNVMKDSLGNDVKVKKYKTIICYLTETKLSKKAIVSGSLDFYDNHTNQLIKTDPVTAESFFDHMFCTAKGDFNALKPETRKLVNIQPIPFPNDLEMIWRTNENLKKMTKDIISRNKRMLEI